MTYKDRLDELVQQKIEQNLAEEHRKKSFDGQQHASFAKLASPLSELIAAGESVIRDARVYGTTAELTVVYSPSHDVIYRVEPNSLGKYSSSPSAKPGYEVETETILKNIHDRTTKAYTFASVDEVLEHLMQMVAEAVANNHKATD
jgi:hypothetical protein